MLGLYPGAAEAGGCFVSAARPGQGSGGLTDDAESSAEQNSARARRSVRRYCAANRLNRLGRSPIGAPAAMTRCGCDGMLGSSSVT